MIEAWQGIGERECNQHRSPPLSEVLVNPVLIRYRYDTGTVYDTGSTGPVPYRYARYQYQTGTRGTGTHRYARYRYRYGRNGTYQTIRPIRSTGSITNHAKPPVRGAGCATRSNSTGWKQGQSALGISVGATAVLHVLAAPLDRRHAFLVSRRSIPRSLVACSAVHSLYLHPSRFIIPPSTP